MFILSALLYIGFLILVFWVGIILFSMIGVSAWIMIFVIIILVGIGIRRK